ncbi:hypothetical protein [Sporosarcina sp. FSL K6-2383]|uniref:hypothetical protein n=1 Tax=Sporosarcina sp. FSL K6-2383 TaxID=2921556 RepID=UPI00315B14D8
MKHIVILAKVIVGIRPNPFGWDGGWTIFKKPLSEKLEVSIRKRLRQEGMDYDVSVDTTYDTCETIINNGASLILISPYIKHIVEVNNLNPRSYYLLNENEYNDAYVEEIIANIKNL